MKRHLGGSWFTLLLTASAQMGCWSGEKINTNAHTTGSQFSDYVGSWDGYAEDYTFQPDGSDRVRLTIDANGQGTLEVGDAPLLAPATNPTVGYPPGVTFDQSSVMLWDLMEGFLYSIHAPQVQADQLQLGINPSDFYASWCALQTSYPFYSTTIVGVVLDGGTIAPTVDGGVPLSVPGIVDGGVVSTHYFCVAIQGVAHENASGCWFVNSDGTTTSVDCGKLTLCETPQVCECGASSCSSYPIATGTPAANYPVELDGALDSTGTQLTATLTLNGAVTVHLVKQ